MNKIIAITGASSGIGLATANLFADNGWTVYAGTRNVQRDQEKHGNRANLHFLEMEVTKPESLERALQRSRTITVIWMYFLLMQDSVIYGP